MALSFVKPLFGQQSSTSVPSCIKNYILVVAFSHCPGRDTAEELHNAVFLHIDTNLQTFLPH
jgi:hypothetical protein